MNNVKNFILNLYNGEGSFNFSPSNKVSNLYSTCFGVMCLDLVNEIDRFIDRNKIIDNIQRFQDEKTGYFIDKSVIPAKIRGHNEEYVLLQLTDLAQIALSALNTYPKYKYLFLEKYKDVEYLKEWFYGLQWKNPWLVSNIIMYILNSFIYEDEKSNKIYSDYIIRLLNETQDKNNGYWSLTNKVTFHNQMAGAYHFMFFYTYLDKQPNYIDKIIDSTLAIQNMDGLFSYAGGGGSCSDLDAIDLLCRSKFYTNYRKNEIIIALNSAYCALMKNQNPDGGFCWAKRDKLSLKKIVSVFNLQLIKNASLRDYISNAKSNIINQLQVLLNQELVWRFSSLEVMKLRINESDLFSTWFRLTSLAFIEETVIDEKNKRNYQGCKLRTKCGLGFYNK